MGRNLNSAESQYAGSSLLFLLTLPVPQAPGPLGCHYAGDRIPEVRTWERVASEFLLMQKYGNNFQNYIFLLPEIRSVFSWRARTLKAQCSHTVEAGWLREAAHRLTSCRPVTSWLYPGRQAGVTAVKEWPPGSLVNQASLGEESRTAGAGSCWYMHSCSP